MLIVLLKSRKKVYMLVDGELVSSYVRKNWYFHKYKLDIGLF